MGQQREDDHPDEPLHVTGEVPADPDELEELGEVDEDAIRHAQPEGTEFEAG